MLACLPDAIVSVYQLRTCEKVYNVRWDIRHIQCDQIGQFIGVWVTFQSLWQQLICPNSWETFIDIWLFLCGHTGHIRAKNNKSTAAPFVQFLIENFF